MRCSIFFLQQSYLNSDAGPSYQLLIRCLGSYAAVSIFLAQSDGFLHFTDIVIIVKYFYNQVLFALLRSWSRNR